MKLKRAKAYRKLMNNFATTYGFREPYQCIVDSQLLEDSFRCKIDLVARLESVLQGKVKPMVTQCDMRQLYTATPKNEALITFAKTLERRRCNHHELDEPLTSLECISSVVGPKNKHRLIVASQDTKVRAHLRTIPGVPLVYLNKSVMIMEPMNTITEEQRDREEKSKFRLGLKGPRIPEQAPKRKRDEEGEDEEEGGDNAEGGATEDRPQKKKKRKGPKQPNPLSMRKKKDTPAGSNAGKPKSGESKPPRPTTAHTTEHTTEGEGEGGGHRKRKRKHKPKSDAEPAANTGGEAVET